MTATEVTVPRAIDRARQRRQHDPRRKLVVEFIGTFEWVAYVVVQLIRGVAAALVARAIKRVGHARAFAVGGLSGGAFNPAVALGASVLGIFKGSNFWIYIVGPILGGAIAAATFVYVQPAEKPEGDVEAASAGP